MLQLLLVFIKRKPKINFQTDGSQTLKLAQKLLMLGVIIIKY